MSSKLPRMLLTTWWRLFQRVIAGVLALLSWSQELMNMLRDLSSTSITLGGSGSRLTSNSSQGMSVSIIIPSLLELLSLSLSVVELVLSSSVSLSVSASVLDSAVSSSAVVSALSELDSALSELSLSASSLSDSPESDDSLLLPSASSLIVATESASAPRSSEPESPPQASGERTQVKTIMRFRRTMEAPWRALGHEPRRSTPS
ncbi:MAG: hypothetical protein HC927_08040 [Deltaproteobacteria bacterium]|nr:hypothetical protein [Deltaproteobacteria bacterium]